MTCLRVFKSFKSSLNSFSFFVALRIVPSIFVAICPMGILKVMVLITNILKLITEIFYGSVADMNTVFSLNDVLLKDFTNILPLSSKSLTVLRIPEPLIKFLKSSGVISTDNLVKICCHV